MTVVQNGKTVIEKREIKGLTEIASHPNEGESGAIVSQVDHRGPDVMA